MSDASALSAENVVSLLGLEPHPEGGFYRETFRDSRECAGRAASTAIYFLLRQGEVSRWHRIDSAEVWHWYAGATLELGIARDRGPAARVLLGPNLLAGERPQAVVPPEHWQQARSLGSWTLVGCTVAPGFTFDRFEIAAPGTEPRE